MARLRSFVIIAKPATVLEVEPAGLLV